MLNKPSNYDPRLTEEMKNCDICANDTFRDSWAGAGIERRAFDAPPAMGPGAKQGSGNEEKPHVQAHGDAKGEHACQCNSKPAAPVSSEQEALIRVITERVMAALATTAK